MRENRSANMTSVHTYIIKGNFFNLPDVMILPQPYDKMIMCFWEEHSKTQLPNMMPTTINLSSI
jgi:hypothetical protein